MGHQDAIEFDIRMHSKVICEVCEELLVALREVTRVDDCLHWTTPQDVTICAAESEHSRVVTVDLSCVLCQLLPRSACSLQQRFLSLHIIKKTSVLI